MSGSVSFDNISRLMRTSESFSDLNAELNPGSVVGSKSRGGASTTASTSMAGAGVAGGPPSANSAKANEDATNKPFGLGKRIFPLSRSLVQLLSSCDENSAGLTNLPLCQFSKLFYLHFSCPLHQLIWSKRTLLHNYYC